MTPEEINIAIAEICGWTNITPDLFGTIPNADEFDSQGSLEHLFRLPDYFRDLNAMHEAEKILLPEKWHTYKEVLENKFVLDPSSNLWSSYQTKLSKIIAEDLGGWDKHFLNAISLTCRATASQRAKAFLLVFNKWKE